jgi:hypothetical protein
MRSAAWQLSDALSDLAVVRGQLAIVSCIVR